MIAFAWTLCWSIAPFIGFPVAVVLFAKWVARRSDGDGFAQEFISFPADVAQLEAFAAQVRRSAGGVMSRPPAIRTCTNSNHPARRHGHYGYGGAHWCSDFSSPLLSPYNMGHVEGDYIIIFEKPEATS